MFAKDVLQGDLTSKGTAEGAEPRSVFKVSSLSQKHGLGMESLQFRRFQETLPLL